jgi:ribosome biogenesis GTPase A
LLIDPESELRQANINKKSHWRDVRKVIANSEVVLYVLDARDPEGSRL